MARTAASGAATARKEFLRTRIEELRGLLRELPAWPEGTRPEAMCLDLLDLLERKQRHRIQDNVRLTALRELAESLLREPDEDRVLRTMSLYLRQAYGLPEVMVLATTPDDGLWGYRTTTASGAMCEAIRWPAAAVTGDWARALRGETVLREDGVERRRSRVRLAPAPLPVILPLVASVDEPPGKGAREEILGLLALRPDAGTGAGSDPLEVESLAFHAATLLSSVRHYQRTREMEEQMRRLDRLAALGRFAAAVAHEIRNPLAAIGAGVEVLAGSLDARRRDDVQRLRSEIARLDRIVTDLLLPTRSQPRELRPLPVRRLIADACMSVEPIASERNVGLAVRAPDGEDASPLVVRGDRDRLLQVLVNLLRNAVEVSPPGGAVEVGWGSENGAPGGRARITIRDRGPGIPPEHRDRLFEPFFTTKAGGTGLGLFVSRGIVEQHKGIMEVEAAAGGGTSMSVLLPREAA